MSDNIKILNIAKYAALIQAILCIPFFVLTLLVNSIENKNLFQNFALNIFFIFPVILTLIIYLGYIQISKKVNSNSFKYILIAIISINIIVTILNYYNKISGSIIILNTLSSFLSVCQGIYFLKFSKQFRTLNILGVLIILESLFYFFSDITSGSNDNFLKIIFLITFQGYIVLVLITSIYEFKLFSEVIKENSKTILPHPKQ